MRWDDLFDELESQLEQQLDAEQGDLLAEEERLRLGRLSMRDRIRAMVEPEGGGLSAAGDSEPLQLVLADGARMSVAVETVGRDWLAGGIVSSARRRPSCVVPLAAIAALYPTAAQLGRGIDAVPDDGPTASLSTRLSIGFVLRDLCRRRAAVDLVTRGAELHGTIDRVARDHLDLAEHDRGERRRVTSVTGTRLIPLTELLLVRL